MINEAGGASQTGLQPTCEAIQGTRYKKALGKGIGPGKPWKSYGILK